MSGASVVSDSAAIATAAVTPHDQLLASSSSSSSASSSQHDPATSPASAGRGRGKRFRKKEQHRIIAACSGAILTSLTMTPLDVVKTRLMTQHASEDLFIPSSYLPPPTQGPAQPAQNSSITTSGLLKGKGKASAHAAASPLQHARSIAATNLATCCQKTYFTTNLAEKGDILCRFDPREISAQASSPGSASGARQAATAASRIIPVTFASPSASEGTAALLLDASGACLYPSPSAAAQQLPQLTAASARHFTGFFDAVTKIVQHEGLPTLWRGLSAALVMSVPSQVIYMVGYDNLRSYALENTPRRFLSAKDNKPSQAYIASTTFLAGSTSRTAVAALLSPLELVRTRMQGTAGDVSFSAVSTSMRDLVRRQGLPSLWRGLSATLWRDVPFSGIYWAGYEAVRRLLSQGKGMGEITHGENASKTFSIAFASGASSGMVASFLTHPFDVVKTRRQTESVQQKNRSTVAVLKEIMHREGPRGLWRGMVPRVAKVAPACGIMIGAYEIGLRWTGEVEE